MLRVAVLLFTVAYGTNTSTPLLLLYRQRLGLSATELTLIFAVYAAGLLPGLMIAGPASDRLGRRRVTLPFVVLAALASATFLLAANHLVLLLLARFLQGLVSGAVFSVASAWLQDLAPRGEHSRAPATASLAMNGGFALGPLVAGVLGQYGPAPLALPYLVHVALVAVGLLVVLPVREARPERVAGPLVRIALPQAGRSTFWLVVAPTAVWVFAFPAVGITLFPLLLPAGEHAVVVVGALAGVTLGSAALVAPWAQRLGARAGAVGAATGALGYLVGVLGGTQQLPALVVVAGVFLGCGAGLCLTAGLGLAHSLADQSSRGAVNAAFYACAYSGFAAPVVISSVAGGGSLAAPIVVLALLAAAVSGWLALPRNRRDGPAASLEAPVS